MELFVTGYGGISFGGNAQFRIECVANVDGSLSNLSKDF